MGGYGSGPYGNGSKIPKDTVEKAFSLEVNSIKNCLANIDSSYIHTWERTNVLGITRVVQIRIVVKEGYIILDYYDGLNEHYRYPVFITWTKCNYGGKRPWFKCPKCYKRVGKLYSKDGYYRCRVCQNLNYRSSQTTDRELYRITKKAKNIAEKLRIDDFRVYVVPDFEKPKGMHWKTYVSLYEELVKLQFKRIRVLDSMYSNKT